MYTNVCYVYAFTDSNNAMRDVCMYVCMYASMYALLYIYDFTESNLTTRYYVFPQTLRQRCIFLVSLKSPIGLKRKIYLKADTHGVLVYYVLKSFIFENERWVR